MISRLVAVGCTAFVCTNAKHNKRARDNAPYQCRVSLSKHDARHESASKRTVSPSLSRSEFISSSRVQRDREGRTRRIWHESPRLFIHTRFVGRERIGGGGDKDGGKSRQSAARRGRDGGGEGRLINHDAQRRRATRDQRTTVFPYRPKTLNGKLHVR